MDPSLLKQREAFKMRALSNPVVEKPARKLDSEAGSSKSKPLKKAKVEAQKPHRGADDFFCQLIALLF
jgi:hypothetical protein